MNDRIRLAEAMGWRKRNEAFLWRLGSDHRKDPPDPFTDANDDYAVLEWMRENYENWTDYCDTLFSLQMYCEEYHIGNYARAALKVLDNE